MIRAFSPDYQTVGFHSPSSITGTGLPAAAYFG